MDGSTRSGDSVGSEGNTSMTAEERLQDLGSICSASSSWQHNVGACGIEGLGPDCWLLVIPQHLTGFYWWTQDCQWIFCCRWMYTYTLQIQPSVSEPLSPRMGLWSIGRILPLKLLLLIIEPHWWHGRENSTCPRAGKCTSLGTTFNLIKLLHRFWGSPIIFTFKTRLFHPPFSHGVPSLPSTSLPWLFRLMGWLRCSSLHGKLSLELCPRALRRKFGTLIWA